MTKPLPADALVGAIVRKLKPIGVGQPSIKLMQPLGKSAVLVSATHELPEGMFSTAMRLIKEAAGPDISVQEATPELLKQTDAVLAERGGFRIALVPAIHGPAVHLTTGTAAAKTAWDRAHLVSKVFKEGKPPSIQFRILKEATAANVANAGKEYERVVSGVVLEPEVLDGTKTPETEGDIYSELEIQKAMYYWMENAPGAFSHYHVEQGGKPLKSRDVILLENWQTRAVENHGDQVIRKGTWMQTNRVGNTADGDRLWKGIINGEINSWSVGIRTMASFEEITAPVSRAGTEPL